MENPETTHPRWLRTGQSLQAVQGRQGRAGSGPDCISWALLRVVVLLSSGFWALNWNGGARGANNNLCRGLTAPVNKTSATTHSKDGDALHPEGNISSGDLLKGSSWRTSHGFQVSRPIGRPGPAGTSRLAGAVPKTQPKDAAAARYQ